MEVTKIRNKPPFTSPKIPTMHMQSGKTTEKAVNRGKPLFSNT